MRDGCAAGGGSGRMAWGASSIRHRRRRATIRHTIRYRPETRADLFGKSLVSQLPLDEDPTARGARPVGGNRAIVPGFVEAFASYDLSRPFGTCPGLSGVFRSTRHKIRYTRRRVSPW